MSKQTTEQADLVRDARDAGISVAKVEYGDPRAPKHWCVARTRDGSRLSKSFTSEAAAWEAVPEILADLALARETAQRLEAERQERYRAAAAEKRLDGARLPEQLRGFKLDSDFPESHALDVARKYVLEFEDRLKEGRGLVFVGPGIDKLKLAVAILEAVCNAGFSGRWANVFDVELCEISGIAAIGSPELLVLACYESGATIRTVLRARENKPTIVCASCSLDRLKDLIFGIYPDDGLGLGDWTKMERKAEIVEFEGKR